MHRRRSEFWLGLWTLLFVGGTAALAYLRPFPGTPEKRSDAIALRITDQDGRLRIDWDANNELVRKAQGATLEVDDGGALNRYPVEPKTLCAGGFDYIRKTPEVLLTLTLFHDGKPGALATVRSIGPVQSVAIARDAAPRPVSRRSGQTRGRRR